jgi:Uma2 family endonuclease
MSPVIAEFSIPLAPLDELPRAIGAGRTRHKVDQLADLPLSDTDLSLAEIHRISVEQYHQMIGAGVLGEDEPVELLDGIMVEKMPKKPHHSLATGLLRDALVLLLPAGWFVNDEQPVTTDTSEPEPDIAVVKGKRRDFRDRHPGPQDSALVAEVADSSLTRDRGLKKALYARAGVPVYWIVNLIDSQIEVYTAPTTARAEPDYDQRQDCKSGDSVPVVIEGQEIGRLQVSDLLP